MVLACLWEEALAAASEEVLWLMRKWVLSATSAAIVALVGIHPCAKGTAVPWAQSLLSRAVALLSQQQQRGLTLNPGLEQGAGGSEEPLCPHSVG